LYIPGWKSGNARHIPTQLVHGGQRNILPAQIQDHSLLAVIIRQAAFATVLHLYRQSAKHIVFASHIEILHFDHRRGKYIGTNAAPYIAASYARPLPVPKIALAAV
jgi:hypothetical protein